MSSCSCWLSFWISCWTMAFSQTTIWSQDMTDGSAWTTSGNAGFNTGYKPAENCDVPSCLLIYDNGNAYCDPVDLSNYFDIRVEFTLDCEMDETCFYFDYSINGGSWINQFSIGNVQKHQRNQIMPAECDQISSFRIRFRLSCAGGDNDDCWMDTLKIKGTSLPTTSPTIDPTVDPTTYPTDDPTIEPTVNPTTDPTNDPTADPTNDPTVDPTIYPTTDPTTVPTNDPTIIPTQFPSAIPSVTPTEIPSKMPTRSPTYPEQGVGDLNTTIATTNNGRIEKEQDDGGAGFGLIEVVIVIVIVSLFCLLCLLLLYYLRTKKQKKDAKEDIELVASGRTTATMVLQAEDDNTADDDDNDVITAGMEMFSGEIALKMWLNSMGMIEYYEMFVEEGFHEQMSTLNSLNEQDLRDIGIQNVEHRKIILTQIENNKHLEGPTVPLPTVDNNVTIGNMNMNMNLNVSDNDDDDGDDGGDDLYQVDITKGMTQGDTIGNDDDTSLGNENISDDEQQSSNDDNDMMYNKGVNVLHNTAGN